MTSKFSSDTATLPYPTHAAIETPQSSLSRGDWGLKRPLPLRSTTGTSTPTIRVDAVDSWEHISNFESASDHVLTLRKWQELHLPVSVPTASRSRTAFYSSGQDPPKSVFEKHRDNTASQAGQRWKFKGPWLAGKSDGEFKEYLNKEIRRRRPEFQRFLRKRCLDDMMKERKQVATDRGEDVEGMSTASHVTEEEFQSFLKRLRHNHTALSAIIHQFLDLPTKATESYNFALTGQDAQTSGISVYSETGPPKTHPSAGLSYLRASSYLINHPKLGPQKDKTPIQGRVLRPKVSATERLGQPLIGVGGIVAEDLEHSQFIVDDEKPGLRRYDGSLLGGAKFWYHPTAASIDAQGRIKLSITPADENTVAIHEEKVKSGPNDNLVSGALERTWEGPSSSLGSSPSRGLGSRSSASSPRARPFEVSTGQNSTREELMDMLERNGPAAGI